MPGQEIEKSEKLANIFVMPDVLEDVSTRGVFERDLFFRESQELEEKLLANSSGRKFLASDLWTQGRSRKSVRKFVILGAPGSGKTTLMSYFAVMLADKQPQLLGLDSETDWLPILIRMRDMARYSDKSILEYVRIFTEKTMQIKTLPVGFFEHWLEDGRALILLDGLDEVPQSGKRYDVVSRIENFLGQFDRNYAIITSRPAGYRRDFFPMEAFPHYEMQRFDDEKILTFINNWYDSRFRGPGEAARWKKSLQKALDDNDRIKVLARNPLLLTIIVLIHRYQAVLPKERHRLYDRAVEMLLISWDAKKELSSDGQLQYLDRDDLGRLMELLAYWVHTQGDVENNESGTLIGQEELREQLRGEIKELKQVQLYQAREEAERFIDLIRERTGLLNEQGQDYYAFVHKTFQEYLCAEEIRYRADNEDDFEIVLGCIRKYLHDPHWREVLLLLIGQQKPKKAAKAMRAILNHGSEYEQWLHRDLLFSGSCLAEDIKGLRRADGQLVQEILERLIELEVSSRELVGWNVREEVEQIFCSLYETDFEAQALEMLKQREDLIDNERLLKYRAELGENDEVIGELLTQLQDENSDVRSNAAFALVNLKNSSETVINSVLALLQDENSNVRSSVAIALGMLENSSEKVINSLLAVLQDENSSVRRNAARALGDLENSSETLINSLLAVLQDENSDVRSNAASVLGMLENSSEKVINSLLAMLQDENSNVRSNAAEALGNLKNSSEKVINNLLELLQDQDIFVSLSTYNTLKELGKKSHDILPTIIQWMEQHQDSEYIGRYIDVLWSLVVDKPSPNENHQ